MQKNKGAIIMSSISGVSTSGTDYYSGAIASGIRLQSAADGAAETAIAEKERSQVNGYDQGTENAKDSKNLLNVADGAMANIADSLNRMRELAVQASNSAILSTSDLKSIQGEIDQLKQGIADISANTQFNSKKILDGSYQNQHIANEPDGSGKNMTIDSTALQALGIEDFDVTKDFSISTIDNALSMVSDNRSSVGSQTNALDFAINYSTNSSLNLSSSLSRTEDTDIAQAASDLQKNKLLEQYQLLMQKKQQEEEQNKFGGLF